MQPTLDELMRNCDREDCADRHGVFFTLTDTERALLREAAHEARTSQAGLLRVGLRLVAARVAMRKRKHEAASAHLGGRPIPAVRAVGNRPAGRRSAGAEAVASPAAEPSSGRKY